MVIERQRTGERETSASDNSSMRRVGAEKGYSPFQTVLIAFSWAAIIIGLITLVGGICYGARDGCPCHRKDPCAQGGLTNLSVVYIVLRGTDGCYATGFGNIKIDGLMDGEWGPLIYTQKSGSFFWQLTYDYPVDDETGSGAEGGQYVGGVWSNYPCSNDVVDEWLHVVFTISRLTNSGSAYFFGWETDGFSGDVYLGLIENSQNNLVCVLPSTNTFWGGSPNSQSSNATWFCDVKSTP